MPDVHHVVSLSLETNDFWTAILGDGSFADLISLPRETSIAKISALKGAAESSTAKDIPGWSYSLSERLGKLLDALGTYQGKIQIEGVR